MCSFAASNWPVTAGLPHFTAGVSDELSFSLSSEARFSHVFVSAVGSHVGPVLLLASERIRATHEEVRDQAVLEHAAESEDVLLTPSLAAGLPHFTAGVSDELSFSLSSEARFSHVFVSAA
jgi:hypothetical protein